MLLAADVFTPSWRSLFWQEDERCLAWFIDRQRESYRHYWTGCYRADYYGWDLESEVAWMTTMRPSYAANWIRSLGKTDLERLIDEVKRGESEAIGRSIAFVVAESFGYWHNRARAKLCRHFKNHPPAPSDCDRLVSTVVDRLLGGYFYEQFFDQLSMAIRFAPDRMGHAASVAVKSDREYIRRYGVRVRHAIKSIGCDPRSAPVIRRDWYS
ncbi:hypothetical protein [Allorhodopirellula solitaria]|uniref:Uncharacterized protein n=1 Tax=Allorhodopirellula solitaria TaxID=2527987 RepID=A0A5C5XP67_9BACT|nr:hypothetical protein [Allorhodopirellula solitaria]TWT65007.1 hypothetical protein CA85_33520 [Allorhodopirellula solitaria]